MRLRSGPPVRVVVGALMLAVLVPAGGAVAARPAPADPLVSAPRTPYDLASRCFTAGIAADRRVLVRDGDAYRADRTRPGAAERFRLRATGLGTYLLYDGERGMLASGADGSTRRTTAPSAQAVWAPERITARGLVLRSTASGRVLVAQPTGRLVTTRGAGTPLALSAASGCARFPEAEVGATGVPFRGTLPDGTVNGFADPHLHLAADLRAGGRTIHGRAFSPFGVADALGGDAETHGPRGALDVTGNLLRDGSPVGTHDTDGWPTFRGWPTHDTNTHQQVYYRWLQRMWLAGMRVVTAQLIEDEPLCRIEPRKSHSCDETDTIELQAERVRALQDYVDAQEGGPGRGWLRIVTDPAQARQVVEDGKLAVLLGVESSNVFGCSQVRGRPSCDRADIDAGIARLEALGVRSVFLAHWVDNALGGAAIEGGAKGQLIGALNTLQTGEFFTTGPCPHEGQGAEVSPSVPSGLEGLPGLGAGAPLHRPGKQCNTRGLSDLGEYAVARLMAERMLIEADHLSEIGRGRLLTLAERAGYPLVSSHTHSGGHWAPSELRRLLAGGGFASATRAVAPQLAKDVLALSRHGDGSRLLGIGLGSDTGGFASLPEPVPADVVAPLRYPFTSRDGAVVFTRQRTGERTFDLNRDGVAHYGLFADQLAQMRSVPGGPQAEALLFRGAEAFLRTWEQAHRR